MKIYGIRIVNMEKNKEILDYWEICCPRLTRKNYNEIVVYLFQAACEGGCDAEHLRAIVKDVGANMPVLVIDTKTVVNGSSIYCDIYCLHKHFAQSGFNFVRRMIIAC